MFSFAKIATVALAFGTFALASPVQERAAEANTVTGILATLHSQISPLAAQFSTLQASNSTTDTINPLVSQISAAVTSATAQIKALPAGATGSGDPLASLQTVIQSVTTPAGSALNTEGVSSDFFIPLFAPLDLVLAALVTEVFGIVGGLLFLIEQLLAALLGTVIVILNDLKFVHLLVVLGL